MLTVIGEVVRSAGLVQEVDHWGNPLPWTMPANAFLRDQKARLPIVFNHDRSWPIGEVGYLERDRAGLRMVGRLYRDDLDDLLDDGDWYFSDSVRCRPTGPLERGHGVLEEISLVRRTANLGTRPIAWARGDIAKGSSGQPPMPLPWRSCWDRAAECMSTYAYQRADRLPIVDLDQLDVVDELLTSNGASVRRMRSGPPAPPTAPPPSHQPAPVDESRVYRHTYPATGLHLVDG
jgi:hypothetical protein